jgi:preprotein translocase subunit SecG
MKQTIIVTQIVISVILIILILLQAKGVGLGRTSTTLNYHSKRGMEKIVFRLTIIMAVIFVIVALAGFFV